MTTSLSPSTSLARPARLLLNADVGEVDALVHGDDEPRLIALLDVANVACGGHAGDDRTMRVTLARCRDEGVLVVAHPGYPDREGFGRRRLALSPDELLRSLLAQVTTLIAHAAEVGVAVVALKPHGALYHAVDDDPATAAVLADVVDALAATGHRPLPLVLSAAYPATSPCRCLLSARGVAVTGEVFVDRGVDGAGHLLPRGTPGALLSVGEATTTTSGLVARFVAHTGGERRFTTACVHGDGHEAVAIASSARAVLDRVFGPRR
jgi:UPF0271 protein